MSATDRNTERFSWWSSLKHGGLLITTGRLSKHFQENLPPLNPFMEERLRRDVFAVLEEGSSESSRLLNTLFEDVLGFQKENWLKGNNISSDWTHRAVTGETVKPSRVWIGSNGESLPVFIPDSDKLRTKQRLGVGRSRKAVSRVIEWMRASQSKLAILTNGRQIRLVHAGADYEAWCEWDIDLWFQEGTPGPQLDALRSLVNLNTLRRPDSEEHGILLTAILDSRKGQAELSSTLGENVRRAVESLIDASREAIDVLDKEDDRDEIRRSIYISATRLVMRFVVILFAESRGLLPRDNPIYHSSYGLQGLIEQLEQKAGGRGKERLRFSYSAWPRLLGLFRLIYEGSKHEAIPVQKYGGGLFQPGDSESKDPLLRALAALENPRNSINDSTLYEILKKLTRCRTKVHQGTGTTWIEAPVDFSDLSTEYIGILYEGLLDFELRRADFDDPIVFLSIGDQPALPFSRLESMDEKTLEKLLEKLKKKSSKKAAVEETEDEDESDESSDDQDEEEEESTDYNDESAEDSDEEELYAAEDSYWNEKIHEWACKAALAGKLVRKPRGKKSTSENAQHRTELSSAARQLVYKIILPGDWFLVRWGGTRKGAGTFYTRPQLAGPTTRRTLEPLLYEATSNGKAIKKPEDILTLKVCDPAMGSGSFLVSALRLLVNALFESLHAHNRLDSDENRTVCRLADGLPASEPYHEILPIPTYHDEFEERLKARLKRHVVERCIYGVDIDPLAVELARLALWVETMDKNLPFHFLDHKLKCGNALVGCWFDRFQDYPVMAWEREGGDSNHEDFIHHFREYTATRGKSKGQNKKKGDVWTKAIKDCRNDIIKPEMKAWITAQSESVFSFMKKGYSTSDLHSDIQKAFEELHEIPVFEESKRATIYMEQILNNPDLSRLRTAFDIWCSIWFWPGDKLGSVPRPSNFLEPPEDTVEMATRLAMQYRFFHWEIEFPEVFIDEASGFDAVVGNPPWEIQKPNSKEFFSNHDPIYRAYGKQEAKAHQKSLFTDNPAIENSWIAYNSHQKGLSNFTKNAASPFGDKEEGDNTFSFSRSPNENTTLHHLWRKRRNSRKGFSDPEHPFRHQGSADLNTYKMFLEVAHTLIRSDGYFGFIVPSGIYTDKGSTNLRELFLSKCSWEWLFGFENRDKIFDIDSRFKFCPVIVQKGGETEGIRTAFMRRNLLDWEEAEKHVLVYPREQVEQFSPKSKAILEIQSERDLEILEKLYENGILLGDDSPDGWGVKYAREFDMTNDSKLFPPLPQWERKGYFPDEYGHWIKGSWLPIEQFGYSAESCRLDPQWKHWSILDRPNDLILSRDGTQAIRIEDVDGIALPLYEGRMIGQYDFSEKGWVSGKGRGAVWRAVPMDNKCLEPQFLMALKTYSEKYKYIDHLKIGQMRVSSATNSRTAITSLLQNFPASDKVATLTTSSAPISSLVFTLNSFTFDSILRARVGGLQVDRHILYANPTPSLDLLKNLERHIEQRVNSLTAISIGWASNWCKTNYATMPGKQWRRHWAITTSERVRIQACLDALAAKLFTLNTEEFAWLLKDCDHPLSEIKAKGFTRSLNAKGFWRVDKAKHPELRHTVLSLIAFHDLQEKGIDEFLAQNDGEGWMLPETLRLADYGLGHDDRAKEHQPVASRLGPRFLPWQLEQSVEESWEECERHAKLISQILKLPSDDGESDTPVDLFGKPEQTDLFGNVTSGPNSGRRK